jgi:hypothetical protein
MTPNLLQGADVPAHADQSLLAGVPELTAPADEVAQVEDRVGHELT